MTGRRSLRRSAALLAAGHARDVPFGGQVFHAVAVRP
jgi:hypothetical protein